MGRRKDHKANRKNAPGRARNRLLEKRAANAEVASTAGLDKDCPKCGVIAGYPCETPSGKKAQKTHADRLK